MISDVLADVLAECGIDRTSPDINEATFEMGQLRTLMNAAGRDINRRVEWSRAGRTIMAASVSSIALPPDFHRMSDKGAVIVGTIDYSPARPVTSPELWQLLDRFPSAQPFYRLDNGMILFSPAIGVEGVTVRYVTKNWIGTQDQIKANADQPIFPDHVLARATIARWKRQKGLPYEDYDSEFEAALEQAAKADAGG